MPFCMKPAEWDTSVMTALPQKQPFSGLLQASEGHWTIRTQGFYLKMVVEEVQTHKRQQS